MTINRIVTKGMGAGQFSGLVVLGLTVSETIRIIRGGRSATKKIYENLLEEFTIAAKLLEINGKELLSPIINRSKYIIDESIHRAVSIKNIKIKNRRENIRTNVKAKLININRGSDG